MPQIQTVLDALDARFPWKRAEKWDKVGLHIGDAGAEVQTVHVCYEVNETALDEAAASGAEAVVAYHPLLFRPLETLDFADPTARLAARLIRENRALICVHSALDGAAPPHALGDALAAQLGLKDARVAAPSGAEALVKIVVFVPAANLVAVRAAMWNAGAGEIGEFYDQAAFYSGGTGTFRPLPGAHPFRGQVGELSQIGEIQLEVTAPASRWRAIVAAARAAHPYEEIAHNVSALLNGDATRDYGPLRVGKVEAQPLDSWVETVNRKLCPPSIRVVTPPDFGAVETVACSPGSGASFIGKLARGTTFVCGDIKHHDALLARARGVALVDVTHAATETAAVPLMARALENIADLRVSREINPFNPFQSWPRVVRLSQTERQ